MMLELCARAAVELQPQAPSGLVFRNNGLRRDIAMAAPPFWIGMDRSKLLRYKHHIASL
jgi:hypothetical protein